MQLNSVSNNYNAVLNKSCKVKNSPSFGSLRADATGMLTKAVETANLNQKGKVAALELIRDLAHKTSSDVLDIGLSQDKTLNFIDKTTGGSLCWDAGLGRIKSIDNVLDKATVTVVGNKGLPSNFNKNKVTNMGFEETSENIFQISLEKFVKILKECFYKEEEKIFSKRQFHS